MKNRVQTVLAPTPRMTRTAAFGFAVLISVPVGVALMLAERFWF